MLESVLDRFRGEATDDPRRKRQMAMLAAAAVGVLLLIVVFVVMHRGGGSSSNANAYTAPPRAHRATAPMAAKTPSLAVPATFNDVIGRDPFKPLYVPPPPTPSAAPSASATPSPSTSPTPTN